MEQLQQLKQQLQAELDDWSSRVYKKNDHVVDTSDAMWNLSGANRTTIGSANDARKANRIKALQRGLAEIENLESGYGIGIEAAKTVYYRRPTQPEIWDTMVAKGKPSRYADSVIDAFNADVAKFREQIEADERAEAQQAELDRANWSDDDDMFSMLLK